MGHHRTQNRRARAHKNAVWRPHSRPPRSADDDTARPIQKTVSEAVRLLVVRVARCTVVRRFTRAPRLLRAAARVLSRRPRRARLAPLRARADADAAADHARGRGGRAAGGTKLARRQRRRRIRLADKPVDLARARRGALSATENRDELKQSTTDGKAQTRKKISPHQCLL